MAVLNIPDLTEVLNETPVADIPFDGSFDDYRMKPWVLLQTKGSRGTPRIITIKHGYPTTTDAYSRLPINEIAHRWGNARVFLPFNPNHVAGLVYSISAPLWVNATVVLPPAVPLTSEVAYKCHIYGRVDCSSLPPDIICDFTKDEAQLQALGRLRNLMYTGFLSKSTAQIVSKYTKLETAIVATDYLSVPQLPTAAADWDYFNFNEDCGGLEFRNIGSELYQMVLVKDRRLDLMQAVFVTFPHLHEYCTGDLFTMHPTKEGLWKYATRLDELVVLNTGDKLVPNTMERVITSSPVVTGCLVIGRNRYQSALIVEPEDHPMNRARMMKALWPYVQRANQSCPEYGRIDQNLILLTSPDKPFIRSDQGIIDRAQNEAYFSTEINNLYRMFEQSENLSISKPLSLGTYERTCASLHTLLTNNFQLHGLRDGDNFFGAGMEPQAVIKLVRAINASGVQEIVGPKAVHDHPTVEGLARYLHRGTVSGQHSRKDKHAEREVGDNYELMRKMFSSATSRLPRSQDQHSSSIKTFFEASDDAVTVPPESGLQAWLQVLASFLVDINTWGLLYSFGVFQLYYQQDLLKTHSPSSISWIGSLQGALFLIVGFISGPLFDMGYFRIIHIVASLVLCYALMMLSLSTSYYQVFLTQGLLLGVSSGFLSPLSTTLIPCYFSERLTLATNIASCGASLGGVIYPILFRNLLATTSFGWAIRTIALFALVTLGLSMLVVPPPEARPVRQVIDRSAFHEPPYLAFLCSTFLLFASIFVPVFTAPSFGFDRLHCSLNLSFDILPVLNGAQLIGRILPTLMLDILSRLPKPRCPAELTTLIALAASAMVSFTWCAVQSIGGFVPWLLAFGFLSGTAVTLPALVLQYTCPTLAVYGPRLGMLNAVAGLGFLVGPPAALGANQSTGSWIGVQAWTGSMLVGATGLFAWTALEARKCRKAREGARATFLDGILEKGGV
ncbi:MAG: hypothetical protein Q9227_002260 [Pyrenula ochraceoflavens]